MGALSLRISNETHRKWLGKNLGQDSALLPGVWTVEKGVGFSLLMLPSMCCVHRLGYPGPHSPRAGETGGAGRRSA